MMPVRRANQTWLPSIFNDFLNNDWMVKANPTAEKRNRNAMLRMQTGLLRLPVVGCHDIRRE